MHMHGCECRGQYTSSVLWYSAWYITHQDLHRQRIKGKAAVGKITRAATMCSFLKVCLNVQAPLLAAWFGDMRALLAEGQWHQSSYSPHHTLPLHPAITIVNRAARFPLARASKTAALSGYSIKLWKEIYIIKTLPLLSEYSCSEIPPIPEKN